MWFPYFRVSTKSCSFYLSDVWKDCLTVYSLFDKIVLLIRWFPYFKVFVVLSETWLCTHCLTGLHWGYWWYSCDCKGTRINVFSIPWEEALCEPGHEWKRVCYPPGSAFSSPSPFNNQETFFPSPSPSGLARGSGSPSEAKFKWSSHNFTMLHFWHIIIKKLL
jgi:hypothetical protein